MTHTHRSDLPLQLRVAIDLVVWWSEPDGHRLPERVVGQPRLVAELGRYLTADGSAPGLVSLGAAPDEVRAVLEADRPRRVVILAAGPLQRPLRRLRNAPFDVPPDLPPSLWRALGYAPSSVAGVQGIGWLAWGLGERLAHRLGRPELADRCRIAMLRSMVTSRAGGRLVTLHVKTYERHA